MEDNDQLRLLASMACDEVQGFLLGKPMTAKDVSALLRTANSPPLTDLSSPTSRQGASVLHSVC